MNTGMSLSNLTPAQLRNAADLQEQIEALKQALSRLSGTPTAVATVTAAARPGKRGPKIMSPAARAKIAAAQSARWAKLRSARVASI